MHDEYESFNNEYPFPSASEGDLWWYHVSFGGLVSA